MYTTIFRTFILYFIIIAGLRLMGKRQIGEMQPAELVTAILISNLCSVPMQDLGIPLLQGVIPILLLFSLELLLSALTASSVSARTLICGKTNILIRDGIINQTELRRLRISISELLEELRLKDVFDPRDVGCACLETNGQLSVQLRAPLRNATAEMVGADCSGEAELYSTIIAQGRVLDANLKACGRDRKWLDERLREAGSASPAGIYLMVLDDRGGVLTVPMDRRPQSQGSREG